MLEDDFTPAVGSETVAGGGSGELQVYKVPTVENNPSSEYEQARRKREK